MPTVRLHRDLAHLVTAETLETFSERYVRFRSLVPGGRLYLEVEYLRGMYCRLSGTYIRLRRRELCSWRILLANQAILSGVPEKRR
jgi:hypothetical protein